MAEKITEYVTRDGDRWDDISVKAYGTPFETKRLMDANPNLPLTSHFAGGVSVLCPIIDVVTETIDPEDLPLWKRP